MNADDTVIKYSASFLYELFDMINEDMIRLKSWFDANLLALNVDKINFVIFERWRDVLLSDHYVVRYGNEIVRRVDVAANGLINILAVLQNMILKIIKCKPLRYNKVCHDFQLIKSAETHRYPTKSNDNLVVSNFQTKREETLYCTDWWTDKI
jgi:hypothetical protein